MTYFKFLFARVKNPFSVTNAVYMGGASYPVFKIRLATDLYDCISLYGLCSIFIAGVGVWFSGHNNLTKNSGFLFCISFKTSSGDDLSVYGVGSIVVLNNV